MAVTPSEFFKPDFEQVSCNLLHRKEPHTWKEKIMYLVLLEYTQNVQFVPLYGFLFIQNLTLPSLLKVL